MTSPRRTARRGGFAMIVALTVLAFVALAVTLVAQLASEDAQRTVAGRRETQARLLFMAGLRVAEARLAANEPIVPGPIALPGEVDATLTIDAVESPTPDRSIVTMSTGAVGQRATFLRGADGAWALDRAEIVRSSR